MATARVEYTSATVLFLSGSVFLCTELDGGVPLGVAGFSPEEWPQIRAAVDALVGEV